MNSSHKPVAVVVGATSKWQSDGRNTKLAHGRALDDSDMPIGVRWGVGGAIFYGNNRDVGNAMDVESTAYNVNAVVKTQGFAAAGEYFDREDDPQAGGVEEDADGYQVQASYTTAPASTQYGFVLGYSAVDLEGSGGGVTYMTGTALGGTAGTVQELSVGVDLYYHENNLKTTFAYVAQNVDPDGGTDVDNNIIVIQVQIVF